MSITLSVPPAVVQDVRLYAERTKTSLNALLRAYMERLAEEERAKRAKESEDVYAYLMGQGGWLPNGYSFDREQANERCECLSSEDFNDRQVYCGVKAVNPFRD